MPIGYDDGAADIRPFNRSPISGWGEPRQHAALIVVFSACVRWASSGGKMQARAQMQIMCRGVASAPIRAIATALILSRFATASDTVCGPFGGRVELGRPASKRPPSRTRDVPRIGAMRRWQRLNPASERPVSCGGHCVGGAGGARRRTGLRPVCPGS
jgi:hypothetical protein